MELSEQSTKATSKNKLGVIVMVVLLILLIGLQGWAFYRIIQLEKLTIAQQAQISDLQLTISNTNAVVNNHSQQISRLAAGLDYVTPLAENGNRWAHTH